MSISYDIFTGSFLAKITEYSFSQIEDQYRTPIVDGYMKRAISEFSRICKYDLVSTRDDVQRIFDVDIPEDDIDEIANIISEGMVIQWLKPYVYRQDNLENILNTKDFTTYSPAELLYRVGQAYKKSQKDYTQMIREYSYNNGDLTDLHI